MRLIVGLIRDSLGAKIKAKIKDITSNSFSVGRNLGEVTICKVWVVGFDRGGGVIEEIAG